MMLPRQSTLLLMLLAAGGVPYIATQKPANDVAGSGSAPGDGPAKRVRAFSASYGVNGQQREGDSDRAPQANSGSALSPAGSESAEPYVPTYPYGPAGPIVYVRPVEPPNVPEGRPINDLREVLRFDISHQWIVTRWPRISTRLGDVDLQGYRVPLVTGTNAADLAGSLTYYFDKDKNTERMIFHGTTGDPRRLVTFITSSFGLLPQKSDDPGLYLYQTRWNREPISEMRIRPARVMRSDQSRLRYDVDFAVVR